ncbi:MAG: (Fe-S)-binding protein [Myxococcota bacterium]
MHQSLLSFLFASDKSSLIPTHNSVLAMILFILVIATGIAVFAYLMYQRWQILKIGKYEDRFSNFTTRIKNVIVVAFFQKRILNELQAGIMHAFIFWGFCVVSINSLTFIGEGFINGFHLPFLGPDQILGKIYGFTKDLFEVLVLIGLAIAFYRRLILKPKRLTYSFEANLILIFILLLMISDFFMFGIKLNANELSQEFSKFVFASAIAGKLVSRWSMDAQQTFYMVNFWLHLVIFFSFLNILPLSKHFHVITSIPNTYFVKLTPKGQLTKMNLEDETLESFGTSRIEDLTWKQIFDTWTCTECGRCQTYCPAYETGKPLSDKEINQDLKHHIYDEAPYIIEERKYKSQQNTDSTQGSSQGNKQGGESHKRPNMIGEIIKEDTIWACTTCGWCEEACPVQIENIGRIIDFRRYLVLTESRFPKEATSVFKGLENNSNPWGLGSNKRQDWAEGVEGVRWASENPDFEYLFYVGCAGSFDDRNKKITKAMVKILNIAGINFAMLGNEEGCCGDSARRLGNEYLYQTLAQTNIETFNNYKVKKIITTCPHGYNTIKNEYPQFGGNYEVYHHTEFILKLINEGRLKLKNPINQTLTYHDSCYLGRINDIYEEPREILKRLSGVNYKEMPRNHYQSFCCGAGGGRMWLEEHIGTRININRTEEALSLNPDTIAVGCPFCLIMLDDGIKDKGAEEKVKVLDISEIVAKAIEQ